MVALIQVTLISVRLLLHHSQCYYPENCPCAWLGLEYLPGETVETPCYKWFAPSLYKHVVLQGAQDLHLKSLTSQILLFYPCFPACVTEAILTAPTHRVQLCAPFTATDIITPLMALNMTTTLTARSISSK